MHVNSAAASVSRWLRVNRCCGGLGIDLLVLWCRGPGDDGYWTVCRCHPRVLGVFAGSQQVATPVLHSEHAPHYQKATWGHGD